MSEIDTSAEAIAAIMEGVTPGPWKTGEHGRVEAYRGFSDDDQADYWEAVADVEKEADQRFIAASYDLVPALAAERDALRAGVERLRGVLTKLEYWMDTDEDILAAMNDWDRSDHLEKLSMIRATLKGAANG